MGKRKEGHRKTRFRAVKIVPRRLFGRKLFISVTSVLFKSSIGFVRPFYGTYSLDFSPRKSLLRIWWWWWWWWRHNIELRDARIYELFKKWFPASEKLVHAPLAFALCSSDFTHSVNPRTMRRLLVQVSRTHTHSRNWREIQSFVAFILQNDGSRGFIGSFANYFSLFFFFENGLQP